MATPTGIQLPPLVQRIILDPTRLTAGTAAIQKGTATATKATNALSASTFTATQSLTSMGFRAQTVGRIFSRRFGLPVAAAIGVGISAFGRFESQLVKIEGLVGISGGAVDQFSESIRDISSATGRAPQELAEAMFFITSAGLRGSVAMDTLAASAKGAAIGLGQAKVVADAATSAVNAYGAENLSAMEATDILTAAVREGKVEADRLAPAIGKAIPVASAMGVEFHEVAAAISAMTRTGTDARTAAIQLRQIMQSLLDPSRQTEKALLGMGIAQGELADQARERGLLSVLVRLRDLANENEEAFADVFPNIRALAGALDITGANLEENTRIFGALANATGDTEIAFEKVKDTVQFKLSKATAEFKVTLIELGEAFKPLLGFATGAINIFSELLRFFANNPIGKFITTLTLSVAAGAVVFGTASVAVGIYGSSIEFLTGQMGKLTGATVAATASTKTFTGALRLGAVGGIIAAGASLFFLTKALGSTTDQSINDAVRLQGVINDIKQVGERSLAPMQDYVNVLKEIREAAKIDADPGVLAFMNAFQGTIEEALGDGGASGERVQASAFVQSLVNTFRGVEPTQADQQEFEDIVSAALAEFSFTQDQLNDALSLVFDGQTDLSQIFSIITSGADENLIATKAEFQNTTREVISDLEEAAEDFIFAYTTQGFRIVEGTKDVNQLIADGITLTQSDLRDLVDVDLSGEDLGDAYIKLVEDLESGAIQVIFENSDGTGTGINTALLQLMEGVFSLDELEELGNELENAIIGGTPQRIVDIGQALTENIIQGMGIEPGSAAALAIGNVTDEILATALRKSDDFTDDNIQGSIFERLLNLNEFDRDDDIATAMVDNSTQMAGAALQVLEAVDSGNGALAAQFRILTSGEDAMTRNAALLKLTVEFMEDLAESTGDVVEESKRLVTIESIFSDLETTFGELNDKATEFERRFSLLFDTLSTSRSTTEGLRDDFDGLADSLAQSGGDITEFTRAGRDAREAARGIFEGIGDEAADRLRAGLVTEAEAADEVIARLSQLEETLILNGVAAEDARDVINDLLGGQDIRNIPALLTASDKAVIDNEALENSLKQLKEDVFAIIDFNDFETIGTNSINSITGAMAEAATSDQTKSDIMSSRNSILDIFLSAWGIKSPSIVMAERIGRPLTAGIAKGIMDERGKLRNPIIELVEDTISESSRKINSVANAVTAQLDLREAEFARDVAQRDFGGAGEITRREGLQRRQLERRIKEAQRAVRLGQGNQEDLELTLLDAQNALDDFDRNVTSEGPSARANLALMQAGQDAAVALARMKMEGQEAIDLFENLAGAVGLPMDEVETMLQTANANQDIFERIFSDDVIHAIERAADGFIKIATGAGKITGIVPDLDLDADQPDVTGASMANLGITSTNRYAGFQGGVMRLGRDNEARIRSAIGPSGFDPVSSIQRLYESGTDAIVAAITGLTFNNNVTITSDQPTKWKKTEKQQWTSSDQYAVFGDMTASDYLGF